MRPCEPGPSALAISRIVLITVTTVKVPARPAPPDAASSSSAACPRSPASRTRAVTAGCSTSAAVASARMASFSATPRSTPANSGAISPWHR